MAASHSYAFPTPQTETGPRIAGVLNNNNVGRLANNNTFRRYVSRLTTSAQRNGSMTSSVKAMQYYIGVRAIHGDDQRRHTMTDRLAGDVAHNVTFPLAFHTTNTYRDQVRDHLGKEYNHVGTINTMSVGSIVVRLFVAISSFVVTGRGVSAFVAHN